MSEGVLRPLWGVLLIVVVFGADAGAGEGRTVILGRTSFWRQHFTFKTPVVKKEDGTLAPVPLRSRGKCKCCKEGIHVETAPPPDGWEKPDFDGSCWGRLPAGSTATWSTGKPCGGGISGRASSYLQMLCMRGRFDVPAPTAGLTFSLAYRGGAAIYLNGTEIARGHLPAGKLTPETPAEGYPKNAYKGRNNPERVRKLDKVSLPAKLLGKGTNVLAVEVHRAIHGAKAKEDKWDGGWFTAGVVSAELAGPPGIAKPNATRPEGVQIWNANMGQSDLDADYGDPNEVLHPIRIVGARNGSFSGKIVVSSDKPLTGLTASMSDLTGAATIPSSAVTVRYPRPDNDEKTASSRHPTVVGVKRFDSFSERPPASVPVAEKKPRKPGKGETPMRVVPGAVQPVWVTVKVPNDARAGDYRGTLTVAVGRKSTKVPVELTVHGWTLPDPKNFFTCANFYQSPDSLAAQYKVPMWSDRHFGLIGKSFELVAGVGTQVVYVPLICRTNMGHAETMVRWIRKGNGYEYDFAPMEKYLDIAEKHVGKPLALVLIVWDVYGPGAAKYRKSHKGTGPIVSLLDPATKKVTDLEGPRYETPEGEAFWRPVLTEAMKRIKKRGWDDVTMLGQGGDTSIVAEGGGMLKKILPDARWMRSSHHPGHNARGKNEDALTTSAGPMEIVYQENAYVHGTAVVLTVPHDPDCRRAYAHKGPSWTVFPRSNAFQTPDWSPVGKHRTLAEAMLCIGRRGFTRLGADFWMLTSSGKRDWGRGGVLPCRYPESSRRQLNMRYAAVLAPGKDGPIPTARLEQVREGVQECEARVFIERALDGSKGRLGKQLAESAQKVLDERTRIAQFLNISIQGFELWYPGSGWQARSGRLYETAAKVARKVGE